MVNMASSEHKAVEGVWRGASGVQGLAPGQDLEAKAH